jgi:hypothetical protein
MKPLFTFFLSIAFLTGLSQDQQAAYELQRKKVNSLLDARQAKFGHYESSLNMRTGIFGLKTKKDMQRSIDILLNVMQTDNIILRETKALLEYKDFEKNEVQNKANNNEQRIGSYKKAVAQLQQLNDGLKSDIEALESQKARYNFALFALITMVLILFVWARKKSS